MKLARALLTGSATLAGIAGLYLAQPEASAPAASKTSPDGVWIVELIGAPDLPVPGNTKFELYARRASGGAPVRISRPIPFDYDVRPDFIISSDSTRVAYSAGRTSIGDFELYGVAISGIGPGGKLNQPIAGLVLPGFYEVAGPWVRYRAEVELAGGPVTAWAVPFIPGTAPRLELFADGFESGSAARW